MNEPAARICSAPREPGTVTSPVTPARASETSMGEHTGLPTSKQRLRARESRVNPGWPVRGRHVGSYVTQQGADHGEAAPVRVPASYEAPSRRAIPTSRAPPRVGSQAG